MNLIVAYIKNNYGIGYNNNLLFYLKKDLEYFKKITKGSNQKLNVLIMGYNTWDSIPNRFKPLYGRINIVLTSKKIENKNNLYYFNNWGDIYNWLDNNKNKYNEVFGIGGESIYNKLLEDGKVNKIYATEINYNKEKEISKYFPKFKENYNFKEISSEEYFEKIDNENIKIENKIYEKIYYENNYLDLLTKILNEGLEKDSRNSKTLSLFGEKLEFDLEKEFPLLTTKKVYWKGIVEELIWFLNAETDSKLLSDKKVKIWDGNSSREYLDSIGLNNYDEGDCGPIYGFQWRHFNAQYRGTDADYNNWGVDQLQECIDLIKNNPNSRRIIMSGWNPCQLKEMALPPCHVLYQWYVDKYDRLSVQMYQRSGDMFLGVPFNIASTSLLTNLIAKITDKKLGKLSIVIGDAQIYEDHIDAVKQQLERKPLYLPKLNIKCKKNNIEEYSMNDLELINYIYHKPIKAKMVV